MGKKSDEVFIQVMKDVHAGERVVYQDNRFDPKAISVELANGVCMGLITLSEDGYILTKAGQHYYDKYIKREDEDA